MQVAWFVSNCGARNSRLQYAHELQKYIEVDIFGACGTKKCPRYQPFLPNLLSTYSYLIFKSEVFLSMPSISDQ